MSSDPAREARPYHGPCAVLTVAEAAYLHAALIPATRPGADDTAAAIVAKCARTLASDPRFRTPTK